MSVSEVARRLNVAPRLISDLLYARGVSDEAAPLIGGRRLIRADALEEIAEALRKSGRLAAAPDAQPFTPLANDG